MISGVVGREEKWTHDVSSCTTREPDNGSREEGQKTSDVLQVRDTGRDRKGSTELRKSDLFTNET